MSKLRVTVVLLLLWLAALFNIERLHEPINLASFVYVLTGLMAAAIILAPKLRKSTLVEITFISLPVYAFIKWSLGYSFLGSYLPITLSECVVLCITNVLAWCVAYQIDEFMLSASAMATIHSFKSFYALEEGESRMYDEVQRARRFQRRLALATVSLTTKFTSEQLDRLTYQARLEMARKYLESCVAKRLSEAISPGDLVVYHDGQFVLMFPEATEDSVRPLLQRVVEELQEQLAVVLQVGMAQFPDEECTLTGLIERAEAESRSLQWKSDTGFPAASEELDAVTLQTVESGPECA